jgi:hypothetical protein
MATKVNLVIDQGTDFSTSIDLTNDDGTPTDLTNYTGEAKIKKHYTSSTSYAFAVSIDALQGKITLSANNTVTSSIPNGRYVYDLELTNNNVAPATISRIMEGIATITPEVTK